MFVSSVTAIARALFFGGTREEERRKKEERIGVNVKMVEASNRGRNKTEEGEKGSGCAQKVSSA
jgi:hypothetical protein